MDSQVVIHPDDCIDCMASWRFAPCTAIYADADVPTEYTKDIEFNALESVQIKDSGAEASQSAKMRCLPRTTVKSSRY